MGVQLGFMGVQLGGKVIWAGLRGCGTAASSRSIAWRTGTWQDQPCRRGRTCQVPSTVDLRRADFGAWNSLGGIGVHVAHVDRDDHGSLFAQTDPQSVGQTRFRE